MNVSPRLGRILFWLTWPGIYLALRGSWRTRVAIVCDGQVLVVKTWLSSGKWGLVGGGLRKGELPLHGLLREIHEEVGFILQAEQCRPLGGYTYRASGLPFRCHLFAVQLDHKPELALQRGEIIAALWLKLDELKTADLRSDVRVALARLAAQG